MNLFSFFKGLFKKESKSAQNKYAVKAGEEVIIKVPLLTPDPVVVDSEKSTENLKVVKKKTSVTPKNAPVKQAKTKKQSVNKEKK